MADLKSYDYAIDDLAIADASNVDRCERFLWWIKDFLIRATHAAPWTVEGSSDAVTAAHDGVDRWGTPFDASKIVEANPGSPHSWIVLQSPGLIGGKVRYVLIDNNRSGWWETVDVTISDAPFTGGTTTNGPTSAGNTFFWDNLGIPAYAGAGMCHGVIADDGAFWVAFSRTATGAFSFLFFVWEVDNLRTGDTDGVVAYAEGSSGGGAIATTPIDDMHTVIPTTGSISTTGSIEPYRYDAAATPLRSTMSIDIVEGAYLKWPLWIWFTDGGLGGQSIKGRMMDAEIPIGSLAQGSISDVSGTIIRCVVGPLWLPADSIPTL